MAEKKFFPWRPEYDLGVTIIDEQHKILTGYIDDLYIAVQDKNQVEETRKVLEKLSDYSNFHFAQEEKYFRKFGYVEEKNHLAEHKNFIDKILEFQKLVDKNLPATFQIVLFLKDWFANHIMKNDRKYADVLRTQINNDK